jgi:hypothetical protein
MLALTLNGQTEHLPETETTKDDAMRRYWLAKESGDVTARLVRVEELVPANTPPANDGDDDPPPAGGAAGGIVETRETVTQPGAVSTLALVRIRAQEEWVAKAGFALAPPLYAPGTRVLPLGDQNFRTERTRVEALPPFRGASAAVSCSIREEKRRDVSVKLHELAMTEHGTLMVGEEEHQLDLGAFYQLAVHCGFGMGARYLAEKCDGSLRAVNVNRQLRKTPNRTLTLRTRKGEDHDARTVYATVTPAYAPVDTDRVLQAVEPHLAEARTEMVYDGSGVKATALWMPDQVVDLAAGDIFKAGVRVETDDTGRGRIRVSAVVVRNRCLNLLIIGEGTVETVSAVHKGSPETILNRVAQGIGEARAKIGDFLQAWGHARTVKTDPERLIKLWVEHRELGNISPKERDSVVEALLSAFHKEPGDTLADAVNAVSRAAHETVAWGMDFRAELERHAARLVYVAA